MCKVVLIELAKSTTKKAHVEKKTLESFLLKDEVANLKKKMTN